MKAEITGRVARNPNRYKDRKEPTGLGPLGNPPAWIKTPSQKEAWKTFEKELPWLNQSHRVLVGIAASILGRQVAGEEVGTKALSLLRQCLNSMGATPADASKVKMPVDDEPDDPAAKYF